MIRTKFYCKCGCGELVSIHKGVPRKTVHGHHNRLKENKEKIKKRMKGNTLFLGKTMPESAKGKIAQSQMEENNSVWNGGRTNGKYIGIRRKDHPFCDVNRYVKEERLIMEAFIGRFLLKKEIVHHKDLNTTNNNIENLQIVSNSEHNRIHHLGNTNVLGLKWTEEQKKKLSKSKMGHTTSEETKLKISKSHKNKKMSTETKNKISKSKIGSKDSEETKLRKSEAIKLHWEKRRKI